MKFESLASCSPRTTHKTRQSSLELYPIWPTEMGQNDKYRVQVTQLY